MVPKSVELFQIQPTRRIAIMLWVTLLTYIKISLKYGLIGSKFGSNLDRLGADSLGGRLPH